MELTEKVLTITDYPLPILLSKSSSHPKLCVIETHGGIEGSKEDTANGSKELIAYCNKNDYLYITYDLLNNGARQNGSQDQVLFSERVKELENLIRYVKDTYSCPVFLIGSSLGGLIVINAAFNVSEEIKGIIVNCGLVKPEETFRNLIAREGFNEWKEKGSANLFGMSMPYAFFTDIHNLKTEEKVKKLSIPILWFHGTADDIVPIKQITDVEHVNKNVKLVSIENGGHRFGDKMKPGEWEKQVEDFIASLVSA